VALTVNQLAGRAGVPPHIVRYYSQAGLLRARRDPANRYRLYSDAEVVRLRFIRRAKVLGFTLADIRQILRDADRRRSPCPKTRRIILKRLEQSEERCAELIALQGRMKKAVRVWRKMPDALPNGESICHLIEAVTE
jgi:DNA-binding transcriptional MerR regulator